MKTLINKVFSKNKLISKKGFTMIEMLMVTLILSMLTYVIAIGISFSIHLYQSSMFDSESTILASSLDAALSDVLHFSSYSSTDLDGTVRINNHDYGINSGHFEISDSGTLFLKSSDDTSFELLNGGMFSLVALKSFDIFYENNVFSGTFVLTARHAKDAEDKTIDFCYQSLK